MLAAEKQAPEGFEPSTLRLLGVRSNQLSYGAAVASFGSSSGLVREGCSLPAGRCKHGR
jgi:hypothetical protein